MYNYLSLKILFLSLLAALLYSPKESINIFTQPQHLSSNDNIILGPRILLLTAHPDDECLFFAPTILSLIAHKTKRVVQHPDAPSKKDVDIEANSVNLSLPEVYAVCLSIGDAEGLGETRKAEVERSLDVLGIEDMRRWVVDHPNLKDNISSQWDAAVVADVLRPYIIEHNITIILTFDRQGISGHPNHRSLHAGAIDLINSLPVTSTTPKPRLFALITVPLFPKYISVFAPFLAKLDLYLSDMFYLLGHQLADVLSLGLHNTTQVDSSSDVMPVFVSGAKEYLTALRAMRAHQSQLVWFRWLYVIFSRYMWVNEWAEVKVGGS